MLNMPFKRTYMIYVSSLTCYIISRCPYKISEQYKMFFSFPD